MGSFRAVAAMAEANADTERSPSPAALDESAAFVAEYLAGAAGGHPTSKGAGPSSAASRICAAEKPARSKRRCSRKYLGTCVTSSYAHVSHHHMYMCARLLCSCGRKSLQYLHHLL